MYVYIWCSQSSVLSNLARFSRNLYQQLSCFWLVFSTRFSRAYWYPEINIYERGSRPLRQFEIATWTFALFPYCHKNISKFRDRDRDTVIVIMTMIVTVVALEGRHHGHGHGHGVCCVNIIVLSVCGHCVYESHRLLRGLFWWVFIVFHARKDSWLKDRWLESLRSQTRRRKSFSIFTTYFPRQTMALKIFLVAIQNCCTVSYWCLY